MISRIFIFSLVFLFSTVSIAGKRFIRCGTTNPIYLPAKVSDFTQADIDTLKDRVLRIAEKYQDTQNHIEKRAAEHAELIDLIRELKEKGLLPPGAYPEVQTSGGVFPGSATPQGSTVWGQNYNPSIIGTRELIDFYNIDVAGLFNQSANLVSGAGQVHTDALAGHQTLVARQSDAIDRLLTESNRFNAAANLIEAAKERGAKIERNIIEHTLKPAIKKPIATSADELIQNRCISCHSGEKPKGGFLLGPWTKLPEPVREKVREAVVNRKMPPENKLNFDEIILLK